MPRAAFCVSSKKEGGTHHSKRDQKSLHRHRNADCQRNRPAGAALPPRLSSQARGALPYYRGDGQPADQGSVHLVPVFPEYRRGCHHLPPAVLRKILFGSGGVPADLPRESQRHTRPAMRMTEGSSPISVSGISLPR